MKYIIDIPDDGQCKYIYNEDTKELKFQGPRLDQNTFMGSDITISVSSVTPYTEPDRKAIEDEVWEFASMLMTMHPDVAENIYWSMNGGKGIGVAAEMTYSEARAKYEVWKMRTDDIHVGDEVIFGERRGAVVGLEGDGVNIVWNDGRTVYMDRADILKTGKFFEWVEEFMEKMRGEEK